ncbi:MAG: hypothetical protein IPH45_05305 [Bacteroidales bacterium]|nr:hypothetical protein [Bacteroidales bacterium]
MLAFITFAPSAFAQEPPHPPTSGHGVNGNQTPGNTSAPIDGGLGILIALSIAYGAKKAAVKTYNNITE